VVSIHDQRYRKAKDLNQYLSRNPELEPPPTEDHNLATWSGRFDRRGFDGGGPACMVE
jgi:hypothetical protein